MHRHLNTVCLRRRGAVSNWGARDIAMTGTSMVRNDEGSWLVLAPGFFISHPLDGTFALPSSI